MKGAPSPIPLHVFPDHMQQAWLSLSQASVVYEVSSCRISLFNTKVGKFIRANDGWIGQVERIISPAPDGAPMLFCRLWKVSSNVEPLCMRSIVEETSLFQIFSSGDVHCAIEVAPITTSHCLQYVLVNEFD